MLWRLPELVQLALAAAVLFGAGAALWRGTWRVLRGGSLGPDAPGLLAALILFAYSAYAAFTGLRPCFPAPCGIVCALLAGKYAAQLVRGALHVPVRRLRHLRPRTATVVRDGVGTQVDADALTPRNVVRVLPGERVPVDGVVCSGTCTVDASALTGAARPAEKAVGTQFWPARSTARAAHSSRPRRSATRRRCSGRSQPCSAHRPCAHRSRCGSSGRHHASPRCSSFGDRRGCRMAFLAAAGRSGPRADLYVRCAGRHVSRRGRAGRGCRRAGRDRPSGRAGRAAHARRGGVGRADGAHRAPVHLAAAGVSCRVSAAGCVRGDRPGRGGGACVRCIRRRVAR